VARRIWGWMKRQWRCVVLVRMRMLARVCLRIALLVIGVAVCLWGYAEVRQILFRMRAERLLADVQALQVRKSTWADAQRFMTRWGRWGHYEGTCTEANCQYMVQLSLQIPLFQHIDQDGLHEHRWPKLQRALGLRFAVLASGGFGVRANELVGRFFNLDIEQPIDTDEYLVAGFGEGSRIAPFAHDRALHPNRSLSNSKYFIVQFTPDEDAAEKAKLTQLDLNCVTAFRPCQRRRLLMPQAFAEFEAQSSKMPKDLPEDCGLSYCVVTRDQSGVFIGDVISARRLTHYGDGEVSEPYWVVMVRVEKMLKGKLSTPSDDLLPVQLFERDLGIQPGMAFPYSRIIASGRLIDDPIVGGPIDIEPCGVVEATDANLADAERGVREDFSPGN